MLRKITLQLPFAHQIKAIRQQDGNTVVLCYLPEQRSHLTPYATWRVNDKGNCFWGHYFANEEAAQQDFDKRSIGV
jgi:hypothetical protein